MTWDFPWEGLGPDQIDSLKARGGHLDIPSSPESLNRLPGTQEDKDAFQRVAARYTRLIKQVRRWGGVTGEHDGQCACVCREFRTVMRLHVSRLGSRLPSQAGGAAWMALGPNCLLPPLLGVQCWAYNPRERPDFTSIAQQLR